MKGSTSCSHQNGYNCRCFTYEEKRGTWVGKTIAKENLEKEKERQRQQEIQKQKELEKQMQLKMQKELEQQQQKKLKRKQQEELEKEQQLHLESQSRQEIQKYRESEKQRQKELQNQKQTQKELEIQCQQELQKQKALEKQLQQKLQEEKDLEMRKQKELDNLKRELEELKLKLELERQKQEELKQEQLRQEMLENQQVKLDELSQKLNNAINMGKVSNKWLEKTALSLNSEGLACLERGEPKEAAKKFGQAIRDYKEAAARLKQALSFNVTGAILKSYVQLIESFINTKAYEHAEMALKDARENFQDHEEFLSGFEKAIQEKSYNVDYAAKYLEKLNEQLEISSTEKSIIQNLDT